MKFEILIFWAAIFSVEFISVNGEKKVNALIVGRYFRPNSTIRATVILNDIQLPSKVKLTIDQIREEKENQRKPTIPPILTKHIVVNPYQATDVDLELVDFIPDLGSYEISVIRNGKSILSESLNFTEPELIVSISTLRPIQFTKSLSIWTISVKYGKGENLILTRSDIKVLLFDSNGNDAGISMDLIYTGYVMIVSIYLDHKIVPGNYEIFAIYKNEFIGKTKLQVLEYKPGPFNVEITAEMVRRSEKSWLDINVMSKKLNGDTVEGDLTIDFGKSYNFTATLPISGQKFYSVDEDDVLWYGEMNRFVEIYVSVRDNRTGETSSAKLIHRTQPPGIADLLDGNGNIVSGVPYFGKFLIFGYDEDHVLNSNSTVKFVVGIDDGPDSHNITKLIKIGTYISDAKAFEVNVEHINTSNKTIRFMLLYEDAEFILIPGHVQGGVQIKARKVEGNRLGNYEIYCTEPMSHITYVLRTANNDLIKSKTLRVNNQQVELIQIDDEAKVIEFMYYSEAQEDIYSYEHHLTFMDELNMHMDAEIRLINYTTDGVIEGEQVEIVFQSKSLEPKIPNFFVVDHKLQKIMGLSIFMNVAHPNYTFFDDTVFRQRLLGDYGIVDSQMGAPLHGNDSVVLRGHKIDQEGKYAVFAFFIGKNGMQMIRTSQLPITIHQWFSVKINAPEVLYRGEGCEIEIVVTNMENIGGFAKISLKSGPYYTPWEFKLAGNESLIIKFIVNGTIDGDVKIRGRGEISYPEHKRATDFSVDIPVEKAPMIRRDYHYLNIISRNQIYSFDANLMSDEEQYIDIYFGGRLIEYLSQIMNEEDEFDRLVAKFVTTIFNKIHESQVLSSGSAGSELTEILILDLLRYQNEDGSFGPQPQRTDIWLTAYIVRMILIGQSEKLFVIDNAKLQKSIDLVINYSKSGAVRKTSSSHLKMLKMSIRSDIVETALLLMMLDGSQNTRFRYHDLIQESLSFLLKGLETNDIIAKVLAIHGLSRFQGVGLIEDNEDSEVFPDSTQLNDMLNAVSKHGNGLVWWEVPHIDGYTKDEIDFVSLELTSFATITIGRFSIAELEPTTNYLLSRYSKNVPLVYWEALITSRKSFPVATEIDLINGKSIEKTKIVDHLQFEKINFKRYKVKCSVTICAPGGFFITSNHQLEEKLDSQLTVDLQVKKKSVRVCVKHPKDSGEFVVELYLPTGVCTDFGFCGQHFDFELALVGGSRCRTFKLHRRYQVFRSINRLPVVVFEKNKKAKRNIYYAEYSNLVF